MRSRAVSYTHLDVYKRQGGYTDATTGRKRGFTFTPTILDAGKYKIYDVDNAVVTWKKHTLQDVYKRQASATYLPHYLQRSNLFYIR